MVDSSLRPNLYQSTDRHAAIGVFDSGIGGLSVARHIRHRLAHESLLYFSDSGYAPYGDKSESAITERCFKIVDFFIAHQVKAIVVACNTATAAAIVQLRSHYPKLIIVGTEPGLKPALQMTQSKIVGVMATKSTLESQKFLTLKAQLSTESGTHFVCQACIGLVDQIERGELHSDASLDLVRSYVTPLLQRGADTIVLGCTHYPFVSHLIEQVICEYKGENETNSVKLIDTGEAVARRLRSLLEQAELDNPEQSTPQLTSWTTGRVDIVKNALTHAFLEQAISLTEYVTL